MYNFSCTYEVQDPADGAVPAAGQHSEIRNVSEEVQPANNNELLFKWRFYINKFIKFKKLLKIQPNFSVGDLF